MDGSFAIKSNLDIIPVTATKLWPKYIQLTIKPDENTVECFQRIVEEIHMRKKLLLNVKRLELNILQNPYFYEDDDDPTAFDKLYSAGTELVRLIPHVQYIGWPTFCCTTILEEFAKALVSGYAHQLTGFDCPLFALTDVPRFSSNLKHILLIGRSPHVSHMPEICVENITTLDLNFVKSDIDWSAFKTADASTSLHFANLKWLRLIVISDVYFHSLENEEKKIAFKFNYTVIAPRLETLVMSPTLFSHLFVAAIRGVDSIPSVQLNLDAADVYFKGFNIDMARDLFVQYGQQRLESEKYISREDYMSDLLNISGLADHSKAIFMCYRKSLNVNVVTWKYLNDLSLYGPTLVTDVGDLVSRLPSLDSLNVDCLKLEKKESAVDDVLDIDSPNVDPVSTNLRVAKFQTEFDVTEKEAYKVEEYLNKLLTSTRVEITRKI
ncbi:hypothetical protein LPJ72_001075 [Coemansia sp. Benny D160-2]|nr:hypothetical protein LPJ72_001075 [Coemansia sp. Benny D160-2]